MQRNGSPHVLLMESSYAATLLTVWQFLLFRFFLEEGRGGGGRNFLIDKNKKKQNKNQTTRAQPYDLAIPLLGMYPRETEGNEMFTEKPVLEDLWQLELKQAKLDQP